MANRRSILLAVAIVTWRLSGAGASLPQLNDLLWREQIDAFTSSVYTTVNTWLGAMELGDWRSGERLIALASH